MDSAAAREGTTSAVQSALDAAYREREEVVQRLEEVDRLIPRLERVVGDRVGTGSQRSTKRTARKQTATSSRKKTTKKAAGRKAPARRGRPPAGEVSRSDRVVQVIAESDQPLATGEVRSRLQQYEPEVSSKLVSASLSYAQRRGRIRRTDDSRWVSASSEAGSS